MESSRLEKEAACGGCQMWVGDNDIEAPVGILEVEEGMDVTSFLVCYAEQSERRRS